MKPKTIVFHFQNTYMFLWISVALPNTPSILSLASYSHLPVFPLMHYPSHIPWDSDRATNHPWPKWLAQQLGTWLKMTNQNLSLNVYVWIQGEKNELSPGVGTTLFEDFRVSSTQSFLAWEAPNSTHLGVSASCGCYKKSLPTWWHKSPSYKI